MKRAVSSGDATKISLLAAFSAIAAASAALLMLASLHVLSPEFSPSWRMVSEYANGRYGWVLSLMFAVWGFSSLAVAFAIRSQMKTRSGINCGPGPDPDADQSVRSYASDSLDRRHDGQPAAFSRSATEAGSEE
jgi:hypothetical protein